MYVCCSVLQCVAVCCSVLPTFVCLFYVFMQKYLSFFSMILLHRPRHSYLYETKETYECRWSPIYMKRDLYETSPIYMKRGLHLHSYVSFMYVSFTYASLKRERYFGPWVGLLRVVFSLPPFPLSFFAGTKDGVGNLPAGYW